MVRCMQYIIFGHKPKKMMQIMTHVPCMLAYHISQERSMMQIMTPGHHTAILPNKKDDTNYDAWFPACCIMRFPSKENNQCKRWGMSHAMCCLSLVGGTCDIKAWKERDELRVHA